MKLSYRGSKDTLKQLISMLAGEIEFVQEDSADVCIIEISDVEILYKLNKEFRIPTFFYINTKDKRIREGIKNFKISGLFFPPLKKEDILKKLKVSAEHTSQGKTSGDFDTLKAKVIAKAESIPALPALARELLRLTQQDNSQMKDFVDKIKKDQGVSSRIIKLVNSPFYGLRKEITSIDRATVLLGLNTVKNLALAVSTEGYYNKQFNIYKTDGHALWEHAVMVALLSECLASRVGEDSDALYLAGLMHDIGKTVLVDFLVKEVDTTKDELAQIGIDHASVGSMILSKWSVADIISEAVNKHHLKTDNRQAMIVYFANLLAQDRENAEGYLADAAEFFGVSYEDVAIPVMQILEVSSEESEDGESG
ncbi:HDOD domain-containing protein [Limisalsivibrio acetivorans]|uniref:HDOD domain-containing protein n=1 Tax=Limisalsivibrio acetivorans TaxID=1304888 RepID=UPI00040A0D64|nr:HDOD domain-containing protein [Limisalsivibrio acetivorans]